MFCPFLLLGFDRLAYWQGLKDYLAMIINLPREKMKVDSQ